MGLSLDDIVLKITDANIVKSTFNNPIYMAIILVIIMMLIIYFGFRNNVKMNKDSSLSYAALVIIMGIYGFIGFMAIEFIHIKVLKNSIKGKYENAILDETIQQVMDNQKTGGDHHQLNISTKKLKEKVRNNYAQPKPEKQEPAEETQQVKLENISHLFKGTPVINDNSEDSSED